MRRIRCVARHYDHQKLTYLCIEVRTYLGMYYYAELGACVVASLPCVGGLRHLTHPTYVGTYPQGELKSPLWWDQCVPSHLLTLLL